MKFARFGGGGRFSVAALFALVLLAACGELTFDGNTPPPETWKWTDLGGPAASTPRYVANPETRVILGTDLVLGTEDGIWQRPLSGEHAWQRAGLAGRAIHALTLTSDGQRLIAAGFDPRNQAASTAWYSRKARRNRQDCLQMSEKALVSPPFFTQCLATPPMWKSLNSPSATKRSRHPT